MMVKTKYEVLKSLTPKNPTYSNLTPKFKRYFGYLKKGFQFCMSDIVEMHKEILYKQYQTTDHLIAVKRGSFASVSLTTLRFDEMT